MLSKFNKFATLAKSEAANENNMVLVSFSEEEISSLNVAISRERRCGVLATPLIFSGKKDASYTVNLAGEQRKYPEPKTLFYIMKAKDGAISRYKLHGPRDVTEVNSINFEDIVRVARNIVKRDYAQPLLVVQPA